MLRKQRLGEWSLQLTRCMAMAMGVLLAAVDGSTAEGRPPGGHPPGGGGGNASACTIPESGHPARESRRPASCATVHLFATGVPASDRENLRNAVARVQMDGTIRMTGQFDLGNACVICVTIDKPLTLFGTGGDPSNPHANEEGLTSIMGGLASIRVVQADENRGSMIAFRNLWFRRAVMAPFAVVRTLDRFKVDRIRVSEIDPLFVLVQQFRFGVPLAPFDILAAGTSPGISAEDFRAELDRQYPGAGALLRGDDDDEQFTRLEGDWFVTNSLIDQLRQGRVPFIAGDDNPVATAVCAFDRIFIVGNVIRSRGEFEIEGCTGRHAEYVVTDNVIELDAADSWEGAVIGNSLRGAAQAGHPAAMKIVGNEEARLLVTNNVVTVTGSPSAVAVLAGNRNPASFSRYKRNRFEMRGVNLPLLRPRVAFLGGYPAIPGFFPESYLQNALITENEFVGAANYAMGFVDMRWLLLPPPPIGPSLVNEATGNRIIDNDFSGFTSREATLVFGESTFENLFVGDPNGDIVDLGTDNLINP